MTYKRIIGTILLSLLATGCLQREFKVTKTGLAVTDGGNVQNPGGTTIGGSGSSGSGSSGGSGGTTPPLLNPKIGTNDATCMSNAKYSACGFEIDPMFQNRAPLTPALRFTTDVRNLQIFGFELTGLNASGFLQNPLLDVMGDAARPGGRAQRTAAGDFKFPYSICNGGTCTKDPEQKACQVQMYHGLQKQIEFLETNVFRGAYYPATALAGGKPLQQKVYAYATSGPDAGQFNNAYATGDEIHLLEVNFPATGANHTNGCDYGIAAHELCHNVFFVAVKDNGAQSGAYGQFHEGQGDACGFLVTNKTASAAHSWFNNLSGLPGRDISGNLNLQLDRTGTVEVHDGGKPVAAVYYVLRTAQTAVPGEIDKIWFTALAMIATDDNFVGIGRALLAADRLLFNAGAGKYQTAIRNAFSARGVNL